jgi:hypothetical protein
LINKGRQQLPDVCYIETSALQGPAHIVPNYRSKNHIISYYITDFINDSFILIPRDYFDHNDLQDITVVPNLSDDLNLCIDQEGSSNTTTLRGLTGTKRTRNNCCNDVVVSDDDDASELSYGSSDIESSFQLN